MTQPKNLKIAIVGAGAAGHLTAAALKKNCTNVDVTIIYDPATPTIGVGESLGWGAPSFFKNTLGLTNEFKWLKPSGSTFKYAVAMQNWHEEDYKKFYFSAPFAPSLRALTKSVWDSAGDPKYQVKNNEPNVYSLLLHLASQGQFDLVDLQQYACEYWWFAKKQKFHVDSQGQWLTNNHRGYAYHINVGRIADIVWESVGRPAGVNLIAQRVRTPVLDSNGNIEYLLLDNEEKFHADLYIDASGFSRLLCKQMDYEFEPLDEYFNDSAMVGQHKFKSYSEYNAETLLCGMKHGWRFCIPTQGRNGNGYLFNSRIFNKEDQLIGEFVEKTGYTDINFKRLKWEPGYYKNSFVGNCIALGLSSGISEAFDANSFSATLRYVQRLIDYINGDAERTFDWRDRYNFMVSNTNKFIVWRIQCAMHLATRNDSEYWQLMKEAAVKFGTKERLIELALDPDQRNGPGTTANSDRMWMNNAYINQAIYYGIELPVDRCKLDIDKFTEQQAMIFFNWFRDTYSLRSEHSQSIPDFYQSFYPGL